MGNALLILLPVLYVSLDLFNFKVIAPSIYAAGYPDGIVRLLPALAVWTAYPFIVRYLTRYDRTAADRAATGAVLGVSTYGIYHLTNAATIRDWKMLVALYDTAWGTFVTVILALLASLY